MSERLFNIRIERHFTKDGLVTGELFVNGELIGPTYENDALKIDLGSYTGQLRYHSGHNFVQGPSGSMATTGDFLIELVGARHRSNILFHGGNKPKHSQGCVLLGGVTKDKIS